MNTRQETPPPSFESVLSTDVDALRQRIQLLEGLLQTSEELCRDKEELLQAYREGRANNGGDENVHIYYRQLPHNKLFVYLPLREVNQSLIDLFKNDCEYLCTTTNSRLEEVKRMDFEFITSMNPLNFLFSIEQCK